MPKNDSKSPRILGETFVKQKGKVASRASDTVAVNGSIESTGNPARSDLFKSMNDEGRSTSQFELATVNGDTQHPGDLAMDYFFKNAKDESYSTSNAELVTVNGHAEDDFKGINGDVRDAGHAEPVTVNRDTGDFTIDDFNMNGDVRDAGHTEPVTVNRDTGDFTIDDFNMNGDVRDAGHTEPVTGNGDAERLEDIDLDDYGDIQRTYEHLLSPTNDITTTTTTTATNPTKDTPDFESMPDTSSIVSEKEYGTSYTKPVLVIRDAEAIVDATLDEDHNTSGADDSTAAMATRSTKPITDTSNRNKDKSTKPAPGTCANESAAAVTTKSTKPTTVTCHNETLTGATVDCDSEPTGAVRADCDIDETTVRHNAIANCDNKTMGDPTVDCDGETVRDITIVDCKKIKHRHHAEEVNLVIFTSNMADQQSAQGDQTVEIEISQHPQTNDDVDDDWSEKEDDNDDKENLLARAILTFRGWILKGIRCLLKYTRGFGTKILFLLLYFAYFIAAMCYRFGDEGSYRLLGCTILGVVIAVRKYVYTGCTWLFRKINGSVKLSENGKRRVKSVRYFTRWLMYGAVGSVMAWVLIDKAITNPRNLQSVPGIIIFMLVSLLTSTKPGQVNYHTIYWSIGLQFLLSLLVIKWDFGRSAIMWTQTRLDEFFNNSVAGSTFLFGDNYHEHYLIFGAFPLLFFTNGMLTVLYYCGAMQFIINALGNCLTFALETSAIESMSVAGGIFLEGITSLAAFRPYLPTLTKSQLFLVITSCFSSIGGAYLAVLSTMGVSIDLMIGAMLMSAPATFTICKLMVPETKNAKKYDKGQLDSIGDEEKGKYANILDALQTGAINMLPVVGNVAVSAFALICFIEWINQTLIWFGDRVGVERLTIELIASYILYPVALAMGVDLEDCRKGATIFGYRLGSSNIVAFFKLTEMRHNRFKYLDYMSKTNGTGNVTYLNDDVILEQWGVTLPLGFMSERSEAIMTYSLCGFSSFLSVAIHMGMLATFLPRRRRWIAEMAIPGLIAGNLANCLTGCFACIFL